MLIVQKYGGTSLAEDAFIRSAARRAVGLARQGHRVVMVVSARGHSTDALLKTASAINRRGAAREVDACIATGEQLSAALMAMAIGDLGYPALSLTGGQAGILTDSRHGSARIITIRTDRLERELAAGRIPVVAGFQGMDEAGDITTLGRGGSDTTAVALAAWLRADKCQIFTDVDGVYDRDPRLHADATRFGRISYRRMLELIGSGAQVLHDRSVELARDRKIPIEVLSAFTGEPGTIVGDTE